MSTFSICHTTARPNGWRASYDAWIGEATAPDESQYVLRVDRRWDFDQAWYFNIGHAWELERSNNILVFNDSGSRKCSVDGWNEAAKASSGDIMILNSDDMFPCARWDERLLEATGFTNGQHQDFVIQVRNGTPHDHRVPALMALQIMSRARYERLGYALWPGYESIASDDDFGEHAHLDGIVIDATNLIFPHRHALFEGQPYDPVYDWQNRPEAYRLGDEELARRRACHFSETIRDFEASKMV